MVACCAKSKFAEKRKQIKKKVYNFAIEKYLIRKNNIECKFKKKMEQMGINTSMLLMIIINLSFDDKRKISKPIDINYFANGIPTNSIVNLCFYSFVKKP